MLKGYFFIILFSAFRKLFLSFLRISKYTQGEDGGYLVGLIRRTLLNPDNPYNSCFLEYIRIKDFSENF